MKVAFAEDNVKGSQGLGATAGFKINASAHAFKILSSGLYSDKVRAVLREIGCNAQDAHIAAGIPTRPIRVKLPNTLDDQFYIQDWGPGLSHDEIMGLYSTYFASTKQASNEFTGAFGLGSKSPFSYTDSFSVVSVHGGKKRTYAIYLDNTGAPTTSLMTEEDADKDWPQGVRVAFSVKPADYNEFLSKAQDVYRWFAVTPEIRGTTKIDPVIYKYSSPDFRRASNAAGTTILMGNVAYPMDWDKLGAGEDSTRLARHLRHVGGLVLPVPIGTVQIAASREQLQYDPATVQELRGRCDRIVRELAQEVMKKVEDAEKGGWEEMCRVSELVETALPGVMKWDMPEIFKALKVDPKRSEQIVKFLKRENIPVPQDACRNTGLKLAQTQYGRVRLFSVTAGRTHLGSDARLAIAPNTVVAYGTETGGGARAKLAVRQGLHAQVLAVCRDKFHSKATANEIEDAARELSKALGNVPLVALADLPAPARSVSSSKKKRKGKNWTPTLDPTTLVGIVDLAGDQDSKPIGGLNMPTFLCDAPASKWGRTTERVRVYNTTLEDDVLIDAGEWKAIWAKYALLSQELGLPNSMEGYVFISAAEARSLYLKQLGWRSTYDEVKAYIERKDVRTALKARMKLWRPVAPEYPNQNGWVGHLTYLFGRTDKKYTDIHAALGTRPDVAKLIGDVVRETHLSKRRGVKAVPPEVEAYMALTRQYRMDADLQMSDCVSIEDLDQAFGQRFPMAASVHLGVWDTLYESNPRAACRLLELILSEEK